MEIFYIGDSGADKAEKVFTDAYSKIDRTPCKVDMSYVKSADEVQRVVEEMDVSQSKLVLGFRSGVGCTDTEKSSGLQARVPSVRCSRRYRQLKTF